MTELTTTEKNKVKFFVGHVLYVPDEMLLTDYDSYAYSKIQDAIANCETVYGLLGSNSLYTEEQDIFESTAETKQFVMEERTVTYTNKKASHRIDTTAFHTALELLINTLGIAY